MLASSLSGWLLISLTPFSLPQRWARWTSSRARTRSWWWAAWASPSPCPPSSVRTFPLLWQLGIHVCVLRCIPCSYLNYAASSLIDPPPDIPPPLSGGPKRAVVNGALAAGVTAGVFGFSEWWDRRHQAEKQQPPQEE